MSLRHQTGTGKEVRLSRRLGQTVARSRVGRSRPCLSSGEDSVLLVRTARSATEEYESGRGSESSRTYLYHACGGAIIQLVEYLVASTLPCEPTRWLRSFPDRRGIPRRCIPYWFPTWLRSGCLSLLLGGCACMLARRPPMAQRSRRAPFLWRFDLVLAVLVFRTLGHARSCEALIRFGLDLFLAVTFSSDSFLRDKVWEKPGRHRTVLGLRVTPTSSQSGHELRA